MEKESKKLIGEELAQNLKFLDKKYKDTDNDFKLGIDKRNDAFVVV
jgi:hypothetical protein